MRFYEPIPGTDADPKAGWQQTAGSWVVGSAIIMVVVAGFSLWG